MKSNSRVEPLRRSHRFRTLAAAGVTVSAGLVAPLGGNGLEAHAIGIAPTFDVGVTRCTFVDTTRKVLNYSTTPPSVLAQRRTLVTEVRYPTLSRSPGHSEITNAPPAQPANGFPMIVFAHGYDVTPDTYSALLETWTQKGFVVAAPIFPDEGSAEVSRQHVNTEADIYNEPADLAFVTRQLLAASSSLAASCPLVQGLLRSSELAIAGHSDGAVAVGLLAYSAGRDPQGVAYSKLRQGLAIRATMIFSGSEERGAPYSAEPDKPAMLLVQSARDQCNTPEEGLELYRAVAQGDKWFLELLHAHHLPPFDGEDRAAFAVVATTTTSFLEFALTNYLNASALHAAGNARPLVGRLTRGGSGPSIAPYLNPPPCGFH
jgi:Chlorophyllase enzyme